MSSAVLLLPGASLYQIYEQRKLGQLYDHALELADQDIDLVNVHINSVMSLKADKSNYIRFYNACYFMDSFEGWSAVISVAKTISGLAISLFCLQAGIVNGAGIGLAVACEGLSQGVYALSKASNFRWHANPKQTGGEWLGFKFTNKLELK